MPQVARGLAVHAISALYGICDYPDDSAEHKAMCQHLCLHAHKLNAMVMTIDDLDP